MKINEIIVEDRLDEKGFWNAVGRGAAEAAGIKLPAKTSAAKPLAEPKVAAKPADTPAAATAVPAKVDPMDIPAAQRRMKKYGKNAAPAPKPEPPPVELAKGFTVLQTNPITLSYGNASYYLDDDAGVHEWKNLQSDKPASAGMSKLLTKQLRAL